MWIYKQTETAAEQDYQGPGLWTVGYYTPTGEWHPESDWSSPEDAAKRCTYLNGDLSGPKEDEGAALDEILQRLDALDQKLNRIEVGIHSLVERLRAEEFVRIANRHHLDLTEGDVG